MPFKKKKSIKLDVESAHSIQKSQSNPEILEKTRSKDDVPEREIRRKDSWFNRIFRTPFRKKRRSTMDLSDSSTFFTPPPRDFMEQITNMEDGGDKLNGKIEIPPRKESLRGSMKRVKSAKLNVIKKNTPNNREITNTEIINNKDTSVVTYDLPPDAGIRTDLKSPKKFQQAFLQELRSSFKNSNQVTEDDDNQVYHNLSGEASSRRNKQRPLSDDIEHIYERTWDLDIVPSSFVSSIVSQEETDHTSYPRNEESAQAPMPALLKFPKPRPPVDRKPSSRRGSKPEVIVRKNSLAVPTDNTVIHPANRRSNAELEEVIQKLNDIPAPLDLPYTPPVPKKRSKFISTELLSIVDNASENLEPYQEESEIVIETESEHSSPSQPENVEVTRSLKQSKKYCTLTNELQDEVHPTNVPLRDRAHSLPKIKIYRLSSTLDDPESDYEDDEDMNIVHVQSEAFKRWNTLPTSYKWMTKRLKYELDLLENSKENTQHLPDPLPIKDCSTQTSLTLLTQTSLDEALQMIKDAQRLLSSNDQATHIVENTPLNAWNKVPNKEKKNETMQNFETTNGETQNLLNEKFHDSSKSIYGLPTPTLARLKRELTDNTSSNHSFITTQNSVTNNKGDYNVAHLYDMISNELRTSELTESGINPIPRSSSCDLMTETTDRNGPALEDKSAVSKIPEKPTRIGGIRSRPPLLPKPTEFVRRGALRHKRSLSSDELETPPEINLSRFKYPSSYEIDVRRNSDLTRGQNGDEVFSKNLNLKKSKSFF